MTRIRAFDGLLVKKSRVETVVSPAYDSLSPDQRHSFAVEHPQNYINAMHSLDEYPENSRPTLQELLAINSANLKKMLERGDFEPLPRPAIFVYTLAADDHQQTAVVCEIPIEHYDTGKVLKHEHTRSDKEDLLVQYLDVVGASSSPVCLAYKDNADINALLKKTTASTPPLLNFCAHDDVEQVLWRIEDAQVIQHLQELFSKIEKTYLTDGHHRFAACSRYAHKCRSRNSSYSADDRFNYVLVALLSADELRILPFNRCVRDLNGMNTAQFLRRMAENFAVEPVTGTDAAPDKLHQFGMYVENKWYRLTPRFLPCSKQNPVNLLDVTILQEQILNPILGIADARSDKRLDYVAGDAGLAGVEQKSAQGWAVGFACHPTTMVQLMQVADSGAVMPPKSTFFDPKMRSGLFLRLY